MHDIHLAALLDLRPPAAVTSSLFTLHSSLNLRPPAAPSFVARFFQPLYETNDLRWRYLSLREERYRRKTRQRAPKPPFGILLLYVGMRGDVPASYEFARVQLTRFRPVASSQAPHPSFCLSGQKLSRSAAPPFPTKPTSLGFGGGPILHCFHGLDCTARNAVELSGFIE